MSNIELAREVLAYFSENPTSLGQNGWGRKYEDGHVTYCFGGRAVVVAGWQLIWESDNWGNEYVSAVHCTQHGVVRHIEDLATELLGLSLDDVCYLFYKASTLEELKGAVERMAHNLPPSEPHESVAT